MYNKIRISIITPLYKGKSYLNELFKMINENAKNVKDIASVEWIISNDYPGEFVNKINCISDVDIKILNTKINRGIQGARVKGLEASTGDYILFLDQDDFIFPFWIKSQLEHIEDADAVVCDGRIDEEPLYNVGNRGKLDECVLKDYAINEGIGFIPGQVLIKKSSIPMLWINKWLKNNCCDDYFLWLCMFEKGCVFRCNNDILYRHNSTGTNLSDDVLKWCKSTHELMKYVNEGKLFNEGERKSFIRARELDIEHNIELLRIEKNRSVIYERILDIENGNSINTKLRNMKNVAIYGYRIGNYLANALKKKGMEIECIIDRNSEQESSDFCVVDKDNIPKSVHVIINTLLSESNKKYVNEYIKNNYPEINVIDLMDVL